MSFLQKEKVLLAEDKHKILCMFEFHISAKSWYIRLPILSLMKVVQQHVTSPVDSISYVLNIVSHTKSYCALSYIVLASITDGEFTKYLDHI